MAPTNRGEGVTPISAPVDVVYLPSEHAQNQASETLTSTLLESVQEIIQRAEAEGRDPDEELRAVVGRTVLQGMATGYGLSTENNGGQREDHPDRDGVKRSRTDDGQS